MTKTVPKATHQGDLKLADKVIECAVLEDGTRVITQTSFLKALERSIRPVAGSGASFEKIPAFLAPKNLKPFISEDLERSMKPIIFKPLAGGYRGRSYGYKAEILPMVCGVYIDAEKESKLLSTQKHMVEAAKIIIRGLATVGIIALVDEATGYQYERDRHALEKILDAYIAKELLPWTKRFPDEFYRQLFRLRGWQYSPLSVKKPKYVGKLTNQLIYEKLPQGVLDELRKKNPTLKPGYRRHRHHQFLTEDIGNPHLERHIASVTTLMRASANWRNFERLFKRAFSDAPEQLEFNFVKELEEK
jgi:hypothetical protein